MLSQVVQREVAPEIDYSRTPRQYYIGQITIDGVKNYDDRLLIGLSGLAEGQKIEIPGEEITKAVKRYWRNGLFSNVAISVDSLVGDSCYLHIQLTQRPRISEINYNGVRKNEKDDLKEKMGLVKDNQLTPNMIDRAKILAKRYFTEKGYKNAEINIVQRDDAGAPDKIIVDVNVERKDKVKINHIYITGNEHLSTKKIKGGLISKGVLKKIHEKHSMAGWFKSKKFIEAKYKEAKENLLVKYGELGYRDALIVSDSVVPFNEQDVNIYINVEEGQKYYIRNIEWVGNTLYPTDGLNQELRMKKGDVYNQKLLEERLKTDETAISNLYYNNGYVFSKVDPVETNIVGDSVDLEIRIYEGPQAHISRVRISGNDRVYENVVRRELRNKPGDLFSREALMRSYRELASLGHFDENIDPKVEPDQINGTVDINWGLTTKSNDQIEFSLGYGQTGVIGRIGLKFSNFCMANLFNKNAIRRGVMPMGNGETFSISGQTKWEHATYTVGAGTHLLRWVYAKDRVGGEGRDCAWLDGVVWTPGYPDGIMPVDFELPTAWYELYEIQGASSDDDTDGDGLTNMEEYLVGSNPANPDSSFRVKLLWEDGEATVVPEPYLGDMREYTIEGKTSMDEVEWTVPANATHRFFRATVRTKPAGN